jgi:hypothetical protein
MGVYTRPGKIDIAMDLPHPVFWMEASASMPVVLKERVVEAFMKLHERGIVHGDIALRHILIGADARVTLIDFQASRADDSNEDLGLEGTYPGEKELEMRRVKFLLNVDNARQKEFRKSKAAQKRLARNTARARRRQELLRHGITTGLPVDESVPLADINEPPVSLEELERYWMEDAWFKRDRCCQSYFLNASTDTRYGRIGLRLECRWQQSLFPPVPSGLAHHVPRYCSGAATVY